MELPIIGLGTWDLRGEECTKTVAAALEMGYRHIDTAHAYQNHLAIKKGIKGFERQKLYLTSKVALEEQVDPKLPENSVQKACDNALKELGTDYLDLYLIHHPEPEFPLEKVFSALESLKAQGKILQAGVSNYTVHHLEDLRKEGFTPFANQVEFHPHLHQKKLLDYCRSHHIQLIAYRPFGKGKLLADEPLFDKMGKNHGKTDAQIILRWFVQKEIPVIPKASSKKHLRENLEIFDFSLSPEEMHKLDNLDKNKRYCRPDDPIHTY